MAKAFNRWDPAVNANLVFSQEEGPLVISGGDSRWPLLIKQAINPVLYGNAEWIGYLQELLFETGVAPATGVHVRAYQYMPPSASFFGADPVNGEPRPDDAADIYLGHDYRYSSMGYRLPLRGLIGTYLGESLNLDFQLTWGDGEIRSNGATRGAWTGIAASILNGGNHASNHLTYALHGKRLVDSIWRHRGSTVVDPAGTYTPATAISAPCDGVADGKVRVLIIGGPPAWTTKTQYWDQGLASWVDLSTSINDLADLAVPGMEDLFGVVGYLVHGATKIFPGFMPPDPPYQDTYFQSVTIPQFTPFVLDVADWSMRELEEHTKILTSADWWRAPLEMKTPALDLVTWPVGSTRGPSVLREFDTDERLFGVRFIPTTSLTMLAASDQKFLSYAQDAGTYTPVYLSDAEALGRELPFSYVGKYKFDSMTDWSTERTLASFGVAGWAPTVSISSAGIGLIWRPDNGGELVCRYTTDSLLSWIDLVAPFRATQYSGTLVEVGFAWTGGNGGLIGRPNHEIRLVINGATVAKIIVPDILFTSGWIGSIGSGSISDRESFTGLWYGGATFIDAVTDHDLFLAFNTDDVTGFDNPSFEIPHPNGRPGEADKWEWMAFQSIGGWADFCAYRGDLLPFRYGREGFDGGWFVGYTWTYPGETERLAATGFTESDVGKIAWQIDLNIEFVLTGYSPITWLELPVGENQDSIFDLSESTTTTAGIFNEGVPNFEGVVEHFSIWGGTWDGYDWNGPPWIDVPDLILPSGDTIGEFGGATGFDGWYDHIYGTNVDPKQTETFEEAWGNDPLSTAGQWIPGAAPGGRLQGTAIEFPLTVPPNLNRLVIHSDYFGVVILSLSQVEYQDISELVSDLDALLSAVIPVNSALSFGQWDRDGQTGLTFGWDGTLYRAQSVYLATVRSDRFRDARGLLGLRTFGPGGTCSGVEIPGWFYTVLPAGVTVNDHILIDSWSHVEFLTAMDSILGSIVIEDGMVGAIFDRGVDEDTLLERYELHGWVSEDAVWVPDFDGFTSELAMFDSGTALAENFIDTEWPEEMYPGV